jgi:hypothetical protein
MKNRRKTMDRQVIANAVETFLDPDIRRYPEAMAMSWLDLRLCLITDAVKYQRKKSQILAAINTPAKLKTAVREFVLSSEADMLLALAFRTNLEAKQGNEARFQVDMAYSYKYFLLNVLVLLFQERHCLIFVGQELREGTPTLLVQINAQNRLNLDLRFYIGHTFYTDAKLQVYKDEFGPIWCLGFHLPYNQLIPEVARIIKIGPSP